MSQKTARMIEKQNDQFAMTASPGMQMTRDGRIRTLRCLIPGSKTPTPQRLSKSARRSKGTQPRVSSSIRRQRASHNKNLNPNFDDHECPARYLGDMFRSAGNEEQEGDAQTPSRPHAAPDDEAQEIYGAYGVLSPLLCQRYLPGVGRALVAAHKGQTKVLGRVGWGGNRANASNRDSLCRTPKWWTRTLEREEERRRQERGQSFEAANSPLNPTYLDGEPKSPRLRTFLNNNSRLNLRL